MAKKFIGNVKGVGVESIVLEYYFSTSASELLDGTWQEGTPPIDETHYLWTRLKITLTNGKSETTNPIRNGMLLNTENLPVTSGGTGADNGQEALANLGVVKYTIEQGTDANGWHYEKYSDGTYKAYQDKTETLTTTASADEVLKYVRYALIVVISANPVSSKAVTNYQMEILSTNSYGWLAKMASSTPKANFRYLTYSPNNITVTITIRHFIEGRWK